VDQQRRQSVQSLIAVAAVLGLAEPAPYSFDRLLGIALPHPESFWIGLAIVPVGLLRRHVPAWIEQPAGGADKSVLASNGAPAPLGGAWPHMATSSTAGAAVI
jgi:hypothetical protein